MERIDLRPKSTPPKEPHPHLITDMIHSPRASVEPRVEHVIIPRLFTYMRGTLHFTAQLKKIISERNSAKTINQTTIFSPKECHTDKRTKSAVLRDVLISSRSRGSICPPLTLARGVWNLCGEYVSTCVLLRHAMESNTQTIQRTKTRTVSSDTQIRETCGECSSPIEECLCKTDDMKLHALHHMIKNDLTYFKNRLLRSPSESEICGIDDQTKPHTCTIDEAPKFQTSNKYITNGYRTSKSRERCIKGMLQWSNETVNIWTHLGPLIVLTYLYVQDVLRNYDAAGFEPFDKKLSSSMLLAYTMMLGLSSVYHIFNCCCCNCYRYWYGWDFVGVCASIYAYGTGFLFLQFRGHPEWIVFYGLIKTIIAGVPIGMVFSTKYFQQRYDDSRSVWIGGYVAFNVVPIIHSIQLRGGLEDPVVQATLPTHIQVMILLVGSYIIYNCQFPERFMPGRVDYIGNSHQIWHVGTATAVFLARHLYFLYIRAFNELI